MIATGFLFCSRRGRSRFAPFVVCRCFYWFRDGSGRDAFGVFGVTENGFIFRRDRCRFRFARTTRWRCRGYRCRSRCYRRRRCDLRKGSGAWFDTKDAHFLALCSGRLFTHDPTLLEASSIWQNPCALGYETQAAAQCRSGVLTRHLPRVSSASPLPG